MSCRSRAISPPSKPMRRDSWPGLPPFFGLRQRPRATGTARTIRRLHGRRRLRLPRGSPPDQGPHADRHLQGQDLKTQERQAQDPKTETPGPGEAHDPLAPQRGPGITRHFVSSLDDTEANGAPLAAIIRSHWCCESRHWLRVTQWLKMPASSAIPTPLAPWPSSVPDFRPCSVASADAHSPPGL